MRERCWKLYCHTNLINNKKYVGKTSKKDAEERWGKNGYKYNKQIVFWRAICKYTWNGFKHEILLDNLTADEANYWEKYYIKEWDLINPEKGYNRKEGGEGGRLPEEVKMKIGLSNKGKKRTKEQIERNRLSHLGKRNSDESKRKVSETLKTKGINKGVNNPMYNKRGGSSPNAVKVIVLETKEVFDSVIDASIFFNISAASIYVNINHQAKSAHGLHFLKLDEYDENHTYVLDLINNNKPKRVLCVETGKVFASISECATIMKLHKNGISRVCSGVLKTTGGYHFKYAD